MTTLILVLSVLLAVSFLCSVLEAVLLSMTHSFVAVMQESGHRAGEILAKLRDKIDEPITAILTLNTMAHTVGAAVGGALALQVFGSEWIALFSAALTFAILVLSEIIPKTIGATYWQVLATPTAYVLRFLTLVMKPIVIPLSLFGRFIAPGEKPPTVSRAELEVLAEIGRREGTIDQAEWEVVTNVMNLDRVSARDVMTPRTSIVAVAITADVETAKTLMLDEGHLRLPVYEDNIDNMVGVLLARDLWRADREGVTEIRSLVRSATFVPPTKPVEDLIAEMRKQRIKMAIVVDEFGGTAGLVTLEDLIEEIVGEIQDEHETEPLPFEELMEGEVHIAGGVPLREVNDRYDLSLPEELYDTIGGYVFGQLGRVARVGDEVELEEGRFRVLDMDGRRIARLAFFRNADQAQER
jgi:putative hemolysin